MCWPEADGEHAKGVWAQALVSMRGPRWERSDVRRHHCPSQLHSASGARMHACVHHFRGHVCGTQRWCARIHPGVPLCPRRTRARWPRERGRLKAARIPPRPSPTGVLRRDTARGGRAAGVRATLVRARPDDDVHLLAFAASVAAAAMLRLNQRTRWTKNGVKGMTQKTLKTSRVMAARMALRQMVLASAAAGALAMHTQQKEPGLTAVPVWSARRACVRSRPLGVKRWLPRPRCCEKDSI